MNNAKHIIKSLEKNHAPTIIFIILISVVFIAIYRIGSSLDEDALSIAASIKNHPSNTTGKSSFQAATVDISKNENAPWASDRDEELIMQRRTAEMMPNTPGVTPDQYAGAGDDSAFAKDEDGNVKQ